MTIEYECPTCGTLNVPVNPRTEAIKCRCGKTLIVLDEVDGTLLVEMPEPLAEEIHRKLEGIIV